jgi:hypothetical protein
MTSLTVVRRSELGSKDSIASMFWHSQFEVKEIGPHEGRNTRRQTTRRQVLASFVTKRSIDLAVARPACAQQVSPYSEVLPSTRREFLE